MNVAHKYRCPTCRELHDSEFLAEKCCDLEIKEVYVCGECGEDYGYYDKEKAEACCEKKVARAATDTTCFYCNGFATPADARDSKTLGSHLRCRACILTVAPEFAAA